MTHIASSRWLAIAVAVGAAMLVLPAVVTAQTVTGQARGAQVTLTSLLGSNTTTLADTGTLSAVGDARDADLSTGGVGSTFGAETLDAVTMAWPDQVVSEASLTNVGLQLGAIQIAADTVIASVLSALNAPASAGSVIHNLSVNGVPVFVTGYPNQTIAIPGGQLIINEQTVSPSGTTVSALHAIVSGVANVVVASATAGIQ
jgi:hypothetical protein